MKPKAIYINIRPKKEEEKMNSNRKTAIIVGVLFITLTPSE